MLSTDTRYYLDLDLHTYYPLCFQEAYRGVRPHHVRVSLPLPEGLPARGQGGCGRGGGLPAQVIWHVTQCHIFITSDI